MDETVEYLVALQQNAVFANEQLMASFEKGESGECIFPDNFCGCWIKGTNLMLALTETNEEIINDYAERIGDYFDCVKIVKFENSYNELYYLAEAIADQIRDKYNGAFQCFFVKESENKAYIGILEEYLDVVSSCYQNDLIVFVESDIGTEELTDLEGGDDIYDLSYGGNGYTLGVCGKKNNVDVFVTAGHGTGLGNLFALTSNDYLIGAVSFLRYTNNGYGDFSFVTISYTNNFSPTNYIGDYTVSGYMGNPAEGTVLYHKGSHSLQNYGEVSARDLVLDYGNITLKGMTSFSPNGSGTQSGDSGCPYYYKPSGSNNVLYAGVHRGWKTICNNSYMIFTPYQYLGFVGFDLNLDGE